VFGGISVYITRRPRASKISSRFSEDGRRKERSRKFAAGLGDIDRYVF
jgi:hypothetical protein